MAQRIEHRTSNPTVAGSSPAGRARIFPVHRPDSAALSPCRLARISGFGPQCLGLGGFAAFSGCSRRRLAGPRPASRDGLRVVPARAVQKPSGRLSAIGSRLGRAVRRRQAPSLDRFCPGLCQGRLMVFRMLEDGRAGAVAMRGCARRSACIIRGAVPRLSGGIVRRLPGFLSRARRVFLCLNAVHLFRPRPTIPITVKIAQSAKTVFVSIGNTSNHPGNAAQQAKAPRGHYTRMPLRGRMRGGMGRPAEAGPSPISSRR